MCVFCKEFGDPGIDKGVWYLNPKNHSRHMYTVKRPEERRKVFGEEPEAEMARTVAKIMETRLEDPEKFKQLVADANKLSREQPGKGPFALSQVVTLQEAHKFVEVAYPIGIINCICRVACRAFDERTEDEFTCMGLGVGMLKWERWPQRYRGGVPFLSADEAKAWLTKQNKNGYMALIMTFGVPYAGGLCTCDYPVCEALRQRLDYNIEPMLYKGHYVAKVDYDLCNGCGICWQRCHYGALKFEAELKRANVDMFKCFGCGLCETGCPTGAITMVWRENFPALREVW